MKKAIKSKLSIYPSHISLGSSTGGFAWRYGRTCARAGEERDEREQRRGHTVAAGGHGGARQCTDRSELRRRNKSVHVAQPHVWLGFPNDLRIIREVNNAFQVAMTKDVLLAELT